MIKKYLLKRSNYLSTLINEKIASIKKAPAGTIRASKHGKSYQFFLREKPSDKNGTYLKKGQLDLVKRLAQKKYDEKIIEYASKEQKAIKTFLKTLDNTSVESIYESLPLHYQELIDPIEIPKDKYVKQWLDVSYERPGFKPDDPEHYTKNDERVRSKSEVSIANALIDYGIPYRIEYPYSINGPGHEPWHPDFTVLNVRTRKEFIWEHFGIMDDQKYAAGTAYKINQYQKNGYFLGDNLLATFETAQVVLNDKTIKQIIEKYLL